MECGIKNTLIRYVYAPKNNIIHNSDYLNTSIIFGECHKILQENALFSKKNHFLTSFKKNYVDKN